VHGNLASKYGVKGYPTIKVFKVGKKDPEDYNGGRTASDIVTFAKNLAGSATVAKPKPVTELTSEAALVEHCQTKASLCLVAFVPNILDGGAKARNAVLETLKALSQKFKAKPLSFVWVEAGAQPALEETLLNGNSYYPSVVALNYKKGRVAPMLGTFTTESIGEFISSVLSGKQSTQPFDAKLIKIADTTQWDGKDGKLPEEEKDL
jgi:protein disulfide-isomerase A6